MKIRDDVVIQKVADFYVVVAVENRAKELPCMLSLNESGAFLWNKCKEAEDIDEAALAAALAQEYGIGADIAIADTGKFIKALRDNGLTV